MIDRVDTDGRVELVRALRADRSQTLIALDFDGTLAPIVPDPADSRLVHGAVDVLLKLADQNTQIAVISGRDAETLLKLSGLQVVPRLVVAGLYGQEWWQDGVLHRPDMPDAIQRLRVHLPEVVAQLHDPGVWIEDKQLSLAVHTRRAVDPAGGLAALREPLQALAADLGLETFPGRNVIELRLPGYDKGDAFRQLISRSQPAALLYAGDDLGDLPAFAQVHAARASGVAAWAVGVISDEVSGLSDHVDVTVASSEELVALLADIAQ